MTSQAGYNDDTIITGTLGPVANSSVDAAQAAAGADLPQEAGEEEAAGQEALALSPALRLRPLAEEPVPSEAEDAPLDLSEVPPLSPMADGEELGLRASTDPLDLDPPVTEASLQAPLAATDDAVEAALADEEAEPELAALAGGEEGAAQAPVETAARREFDGTISVTGDPGQGPRMTLPEVVSRAATMHPEITLALARVDEARAGVQRARSGLGPQVDVRLATGQEANGTVAPYLGDAVERESGSAMRLDGSIRLRQLLFDFNATRDEVLSTVAASDAARLRTIDVTEDIALRTAQAYLRILQQRQLLALIDRNIAEHVRLLQIVELNEADGNSTMADVNRVSARLSEVRSARTDLAADLDAAEDAFERLARIEPGRLDPPQPVVQLLAPNADQAVERALTGNPSLLSLSYTLRSLQHELDVVNGDGNARIDLELEANSRNYFSDGSRSENDLRGMVVFSYSLFDAGDSEGKQREAESRIRQARARYTDRRDQVEADIRQAYRAIASARRKLSDLREGLASSREVQALYTEQFQAGERTIFELLDAQSALFSAERELIVSQFSELEAAYSVLRSTGRLTSTLLNAS